MEGWMMTHDDRAAYVRSIIQARCPELTDADLASTEARSQPADNASTEAVLPVEIGHDIMSVLEAMESKLDQLVEAIGDGDADDLAG
jgi:hypothetical protein